MVPWDFSGGGGGGGAGGEDLERKSDDYIGGV